MKNLVVYFVLGCALSWLALLCFGWLGWLDAAPEWLVGRSEPPQWLTLWSFAAAACILIDSALGARE